MIQTSATAWLGFLILLAMSSGAGWAIARLIPWNETSKFSQAPIAFGLALGPFLAGLGIIVALYLFPGATHTTHLWIVAIILLGINALHIYKRSSLKTLQGLKPPSLGYYLLVGLLLLWLIALLANTLFIPLTQNDALEYATVGRELFHSRTLASYPLLNSATNQSGFFGPWTHPPLYVSLIYLTSIIQGHANDPGLMRLIAPWFLLSSTLGVISLGTLRSRNIGLLSGLLCLSTPLLFLGADSALIDALPFSAMVLLLLVLIGCNKDNPLYPVWLGIILGVSLWTHSEAILLIPIMTATLILQRGLISWRTTSKDIGIVIGIACLIAAQPYLRNWSIFGSPVSDNPLVFALPILDWAGYFQYTRGLDNWVAILQYGLLKGWFSLEAYGYLFWIWTLGLISFARTTFPIQLLPTIKFGINQTQPPMQVLWISITIVMLYLAGVLASVLLGIDLMIRNERYMLMIVPAVALGAAYGIERLSIRLTNVISNTLVSSWRRDSILIIAWTVAATLLLQFAIVGWYYRWRDVPSIPKRDAFSNTTAHYPPRFEWILDHWASFRTVRQMKTLLPTGSVVLSMRPADMYYSGMRMISYLDPRLLAMYQKSSPERAVKMLHDLGITHIHSVDYTLPPIYNSVLQAILADPRLSKLEYSNAMFQVFSLQDSGLKELPAANITPGNSPWSTTKQLRIGGRKALNVLGLAPQKLEQPNSASYFSLFQRDYSVLLSSGWGVSLSPNPENTRTFFPIKDAEYLLRIKLNGQGFVRLWIAQFDQFGIPIMLNTIERNKPIRIGELVLSSQYPRKNFLRRFRPDSKARFLRVGIEHVGQSYINVENVSLSELVPLISK